MRWSRGEADVERRNEIEYPLRPGDDVQREESAAALETTASLIEKVRRLLPNLSFF